MMQAYKTVDKKNDTQGWVGSLLIHALLLLLLFFYNAWTMPDPPPEGWAGAEINFGFTDAGMGEVSPSTGEVQTNSEALPTEENPIETPTPNETLPQPQVETSTQVSPHVVEKQTPKETTKPNTQTQTTQNQQIQNQQKPNTDKPGQNDGNTNKPGNQGNTNGNVDSRSLMQGGTGNQTGTGNGGNGASLNMAGWEWTAPPKVSDVSNESGKIRFKVTVDNEGALVKVEVLESQVTAATLKYYTDAVWKLDFQRTAGGQVAPLSSGIIEFRIRMN